MKRLRRWRHQAGILVALVFVAAAFTHHDARSQTARTIRFVVPSAPAGVNDIMARLLGEQIQRAHGVTVVIDNRPGAGEVIGTETAMRAAPDGNTLLFVANPFVINPHLRKTSYDPLTSFEPICQLTSAPTLIVVHGASPYRSLSDLLDDARKRPGQVTIASIGPGSPFHLGVESLKRAAKADLTFVPYTGNALAVNALLGQHVTAMFGTYANVAQQLKAGTLRALAAGKPTRMEPLPELPTVAELGFEDYEVDAWFGVLAPAKTSKEMTAQLAQWFTAAMQVPEAKEKLVAQGLYPVAACGADFSAHLRRQFDAYGRVIREANIKGE
jgi:tripartite-type tricarboxylate transporter receptor subunit TctC